MKHYILLLLAIPIVLQSCSSMYIPATRSIPLLEKKGEFQAEAGISTNSIYANGSYAFSDKIAASINGNLSYRNFSNRYDLFTHKDAPPPLKGSWNVDARGNFAHRYGEVSVGRINMRPTSPMKLEVFGGMGMGRATDVDHFRDDNRYKVDYYSFFGQGNLGLKKRMVEAGASVRLGYSYFNYEENLYKNEYILHRKTINALHVEPMLFARIGTERWKFVYRVGVNLALTINPTENSIQYDGLGLGLDGSRYTVFHMSIGVSYRLGGK